MSDSGIKQVVVRVWPIRLASVGVHTHRQLDHSTPNAPYFG
jgi:hypothetical protein